jgi:tetraacyldisaccharide 4'-kinase
LITTTSTFRQRLLGPDAGVLVFLLRLLLLPLSGLYYAVVTVRNALYDAGLLEEVRVAAPVVSVGNLTVGGTGKTPMVIALANRAVAAGRRVAVVARGYGAVADASGRTDEVALIAARCPGARVVVAPDKLLGARWAVAEGADFVIVDDGLQHRRLHRDLEVVMVDGRAPFGNGSVLPGGPLREPPSGLARADVIVLTHAETLDEAERQTVLTQLRAFRLSVPIVRADHVPLGVRAVTGGPLLPASSLAGRDVFLFCGIASPAGFAQTVTELGAHVTGVLAFPDHHAFGPGDLARVRAAARHAQLVCTEKDALKVARIPGHEDVLCLAIELRLHGEFPPVPGLDAPWKPPAPPSDVHAGHAHAPPPGELPHADSTGLAEAVHAGEHRSSVEPSGAGAPVHGAHH